MPAASRVTAADGCGKGYILPVPLQSYSPRASALKRFYELIETSQAEDKVETA